ncbi:hypothetical protein TrVE_jg13824 [Triparma verrucosa]|uniref:Uncharacterized protein n=1 Tax=Triparma verrucosa TaxID=1606542 RepID=A0A9W7KVX1_9STRA|nr:hypothetical protein TrVE_jg13824 [Triparma verrucosa]
MTEGLSSPSAPLSQDDSTPDELILTKPGQKFQTPTPGDADRVFYESLYNQKPTSPMAINYVIEYGILPDEEHSKILKIYLSKKRNPTQSTVKKDKKVKVIDETGGDTGFEGGGMEGVGVGAI